jgi:hypothetical protein
MAVNAAAIAERCRVGVKIKKELRRQRVAAIAAIKGERAG